MYNRYKVITEKFTELVEKELSTTEDGEPMWTCKGRRKIRGWGPMR